MGWYELLMFGISIASLAFVDAGIKEDSVIEYDEFIQEVVSERGISYMFSLTVDGRSYFKRFPSREEAESFIEEVTRGDYFNDFNNLGGLR